MNLEPKELPPLAQRIEDLSGNYVELFNRDSILVDTRVLGGHLWRQVVDATQRDNRERGFMVSRKRNGTILTSEIYASNEGESHKDISIWSYSNTLRTFFTNMQNLTVIHTHPMPSRIEHLKTTPVSDEDLQDFLDSRFKAIVMLDRGGAHLLVPIRPGARPNKLIDKELVKKAVDKIRLESGGSMDVIKEVAAQLESYGIGYFYTPELPQPDERFVKLHNPKNF